MSSNIVDSKLTDLIAHAEDGFSYHKKSFLAFERMYFNELDEETYNSLGARGKSRLSFPKARAKCKRVSKELNRAYFTNDKFASISPDSDNEPEDIVMAINKLEKATSYYTKNMQLFSKLQPNIRKVPYIGTAIAKSYWDGEKVEIESVDIDEIFFDPDSRTAEGVTLIVHDIYKTVEEVKELQRQGLYLRIVNANEVFGNEIQLSTQRVKLQEVYKLEKDGFWYVSTIYNQSISFRHNKKLNDGHPFTFGGLMPQLRRIGETKCVMAYYEPLIFDVESLQDEYNIRRNQQIDAIAQFLNPRAYVPSTAMLNPLDHEKPSGPIRVASATGIVPVPLPNIQPAMFDTQNLENDMSEVSGVSAMMNGISSDTKKTATEKGIEHSEGSVNLADYTRNFNETFFSPLIRRTAMLIWKYAPAKFFQGVDRSLDLKFKVEFNTGLGVTNDVVKKENLGQAYSMMSDLLKVQLELQDEDARYTIKGLKKVVAETLPLIGIKNTEEYLGKEIEDAKFGESNRTGNNETGNGSFYEQ